MANCISQTHALVHRLPLVKDSQWQDEQEHRITITEHLGGRSLNQMSALHGLGEPFSFYAQGALMTVDVQFRPESGKAFIPYVRLPFEREALLKVVIGPVNTHHLAEATVRRLLDRRVPPHRDRNFNRTASGLSDLAAEGYRARDDLVGEGGEFVGFGSVDAGGRAEHPAAGPAPPAPGPPSSVGGSAGIMNTPPSTSRTMGPASPRRPCSSRDCSGDRTTRRRASACSADRGTFRS